MRRSLLLLLLALSFPCWAGGYCLSYCKPGPLYCGAWSVALRAGGVPTSYAKQEEIWWTIPGNIPPVLSAGNLPDFLDQFRLPWEVDGELALNLSRRVQAFIQYQFQQGGGRDEREVSWSRYQSHSGYIGSRLFYRGCCFRCFGRIAPFIGVKLGLMWREKIIQEMPGAIFCFSSDQLAPSVGMQVGLEWWMTWYWSLIFQIDGIATKGLKSNQNAAFSPALPNGVTNINVPSGSAIFSFPITAGMRLTF